jgi:Golgi nucleoside diphosphatase
MDDQQHTRKRQHRIRSIINFLQGVAVTLFIFAVIVAIYLIVTYRARVKPFINYAIVFDAGSSHTEMFVYNWPADKSNGLGTTSTVNEYFVCPLAGVHANNSKKSGDSIKLKAVSDFEQHLDLLDTYFQPCLQRAISEIPSNRHKFSPIFLGATAGMRLSRLQNATRANQIFEKIREIFSNYPFQFVTARQVSFKKQNNELFSN